MQKRYLIGVDLGTSSTKSALYTTDGTLVASATVDVPIYYPAPGVVEQENDDFYQTAAQTVKQCLQSSGIYPRQVAAIAFDSQMAGIGTVDEDFNPATRFNSWLDMRCQPYIEFIAKNHTGSGHAPDGLPTYLRSWTQGLMVERGAAQSLSTYCEVRDPCGLCSWQDGWIEGRRCIHRLYFHSFFRFK